MNQDQSQAQKTTDASIPAQEGTIEKPEPFTPKRRARQINDIINFDGEMYRIYKMKDNGKKVGLCRLNREEQHKVLLKIRAQQEAAIRKVKEMEVDPKRVIDMPPAQMAEQEPVKSA